MIASVPAEAWKTGFLIGCAVGVAYLAVFVGPCSEQWLSLVPRSGIPSPSVLGPFRPEPPSSAAGDAGVE